MSDLPAPSKIVGVDWNYPGHEEDPTERRGSKGPRVFLKPSSSLLGPGEPIQVPPGAGRVDHEGEVGLVIGRRARHLRASAALEAVAGVLPLNDVTARDMQSVDGTWGRAKGFDSFCPVGPVTPLDEVALEELSVVTRLNGEVRQRARAAEMIVPIPDLVAYISRIMTLEPGDLVATGTPPGVGPIVPWDQVEVVLPGMGSVSNPVRLGKGTPWATPTGDAP